MDGQHIVMTSKSHLMLRKESKSKESRVQFLCRTWGKGRESQQAASVDRAFITFLTAMRKQPRKAEEVFVLALRSPSWLGRHGGRSVRQPVSAHPHQGAEADACWNSALFLHIYSCTRLSPRGRGMLLNPARVLPTTNNSI